MNADQSKPRWKKILELEAKAKEREKEFASQEAAARASVRSCKGRGAILELHDDCIVIRRTAVWSLLFQGGIKGEKRIPFSSITAVQFKRPVDHLIAGYIQFTLAGGVEDRGGIGSSVSDENSVQFMIEGEFEKARNYIESKLAARERAPAQGATHTITVAEQLEKLASLVERGLLTLDEFTAQKRTLLGSPPTE